MDTLAEGLSDEMARDVAEAAPTEPDEQDRSKLDALTQQMVDVRLELDEVTERKAALEKRWNELRRVEMPELMQRLGMIGPDGKGRFTHASGAKIHLQVEVFANVRATDRDDFYTWLRDNNHGDLIKETVHHQTLVAFAKELLRDGKTVPGGLLQVETGSKAVLTRPKEQEL